jgi:hypothetical protein
MYYIWSLVAALSIFGAIQWNEYKKQMAKHLPYNPYTFSNLSTLLIMYLLLTIVFYMLLGVDHSCLNKIDHNAKAAKTGKQKGGDDFNMMLDPVMLRRIPEQVYTGFNPYDARGDF